MSSLFEKAIADAKELKETALKNAEQVIIERYSSELKETIENLLEQDEEEMLDPAEEEGEELAGLDALAGEETEDAEAVDSLMVQVPDAATMALAQALEDDQEEIVINFDELMADYEASAPEEEAMEVPLEAEPAVDREEELAEMPEEEMAKDEEEEADLDAMMEELTEEQMDALLEEVEVNYKSVHPSNGWAGSTEGDRKENAELVACKMAFEELQKEHKEKVEENLKLNESLQEAKENLIKAKSVLQEMKSKITEVNRRNAKLYYTTKVLESKELNARQKSKIVESLAKASTIEETKLVYETLKESVGASEKKTPESLVEAVNRTRSLVLSSQKREEKKEVSPMYDHWKKLAGINKKGEK